MAYITDYILGTDPHRSLPAVPYDTKHVEGGSGRGSGSVICAGSSIEAQIRLPRHLRLTPVRTPNV